MENSKKKILHFKITYILLLVAVISMPFTNYLLLPIELLIFLNWIIEWNWKEKILNLKNNHLSKSLIIALLFPFLTIIGFVYSSNMRYALADFDCKSWLILAPIAIFTIDKKLLNLKRINQLIFLFILSTVFMILCNFLRATILDLYSSDSTNYFTYVALSHYMHPTYSSMYACMCFVFSFWGILLYSQKKIKLNKYVFTIIITCLLISPIYIFSLQSKAGIILLLFCFAYLIIYSLVKYENFKIKAIVMLFIFIGLFIISDTISTKGTSRFFSAIKEIKNLSTTIYLDTEQNNTEEKKNEVSINQVVLEEDIDHDKEEEINIGGTAIRLIIWKYSTEATIDNLPFGVGTGDVQDCLNEYYTKHKLHKSFKNNNLNAHNQYLQTSLGLGIPGIISLLLLFCYPLYYAIKSRNHVYILFASITCINMLFESTLNIRAGVNFIAIFNCLLWIIIFNKDLKIPE